MLLSELDFLKKETMSPKVPEHRWEYIGENLVIDFPLRQRNLRAEVLHNQTEEGGSSWRIESIRNSETQLDAPVTVEINAIIRRIVENIESKVGYCVEDNFTGLPEYEDYLGEEYNE